MALSALGPLVQPALAQIPLPSGTAMPSAETTTAFLKSLRISGIEAEHGLATFAWHPTPGERKSLQGAGVRILSPLIGTTYRVRVDNRVNARAREFWQLKTRLIRLTAQDRVDPRLWREEYSRYGIPRRGETQRNYVMNGDGTLNLSIRFHRGVSQDLIRRTLSKHARGFKREGDQAWFAVMTPASLRALAAEDMVQWIDAGPLPFISENDKVRDKIGVESVQNFDETAGRAQGLSGNEVRIGVFDKGVDETHDDFNDNTLSGNPTRVVASDAGKEHHGTHLAGTIGGNGVLSIANGSTKAYQWRGMAPRAQLLDIDQKPPFGQNGKNPDTHMRYIASPGMDLSNHSYVFSLDGAYDSSNQARDEIIRGDALSDGSLVPPRLQVTSAGNNGLTAYQDENVTSYQRGYFSLSKQVKNALVVGNWDNGSGTSGRIASKSSLGPTHDGRIKPDVVAPGENVKSTGFKSSATEYRAMSGTSMASAAATGVLALMLEQHATTSGVGLAQDRPLPSTLRAVIIHTAEDKKGSPSFDNGDGVVQDSIGPDFVTGWGLINAKKAQEVIIDRRLREDVLTTTCDSKTYLFSVTPAAAVAGVRVTLAWDDPAADALLITDPTAPTLRNDLDLVLIDPNGTVHYPWQVNQNIRDSAGVIVPNEMQHCGIAVTVEAQLKPRLDPENGDDNVSGGPPTASRGRDHLNNVEVVDVGLAGDPPAIPGIWQARVTGFAIAESPQRFSLIGVPFTLLLQGPKSICARFPALCRAAAIGVNLCLRHPKFCEPRIWFPGPSRMHARFDDLRQKIVLPLDGICRYAAKRPEAHCAGHELRVESTTTQFQADIYRSDGRLMQRDKSAKFDKRLSFPADRGEEYFLVLSPAPGMKPGAELEVSLTPR